MLSRASISRLTSHSRSQHIARVLKFATATPPLPLPYIMRSSSTISTIRIPSSFGTSTSTSTSTSSRGTSTSALVMVRSFSSLNCVMEGQMRLLYNHHQYQHQHQQHHLVPTTTTTTTTTTQQQRTFAAAAANRRQKGGRRGGAGSNIPPPLSNENLIRVLMKQASDPKELTVRVVIDAKEDGHRRPTENNNNDDDDDDDDSPSPSSSSSPPPSIVQVVSLAEAIEISIDRNLDLVAATLDSNPPTIRCTQLSKLLFKKEQSIKQNLQQQSKTRQKSKTFRFKAGIGTADLERKVENMIKCLQDGMECEYTVFSKAFLLRNDANVGTELSTRIQDLVSEYGTLKRKPQVNEKGNHIKCVIEPKRKGGKKK